MRSKLIALACATTMLVAGPAFGGEDGFLRDATFRFGMAGGRIVLDAHDVDLTGRDDRDDASLGRRFGAVGVIRRAVVAAGQDRLCLR